MFDNLVVSNPKKRGFKSLMGGPFFSTVVHAVIIYAAIQATLKATGVTEEVTSDTTMVFMQEQQQEQEPEPEPERPVIARIEPVARGFQTLTAPIDIPDEIAPPDLTESFDARNFSGEGLEGGVFDGVEGATATLDLTQTFLEAVVDERPERISCPPLNYPPMLQQANITGQVVFEAVIGSDGRIDPASLNVIQSDHEGFVRPARDMFTRCLYRPGRIRGQAVAVLVQQPITFGISRNR